MNPRSKPTRSSYDAAAAVAVALMRRDMTVADRIGAALRDARNAAGLSQWDVDGMRLGIHQPDLSKIETGKQLPTVATLLTLAKAYGTTVVDICARSGIDNAEGKA